MTWQRVDDTFHSHPKVIRLLEMDRGLEALGLWTLALSWAGGKGHGPVISLRVAMRLLTTAQPARVRAHADRLVLAGLWEPSGGDAWVIHDFAHYGKQQPTPELSAKRAESGRRGAAVRHGEKVKVQPKVSPGLAQGSAGVGQQSGTLSSQGAAPGGDLHAENLATLPTTHEDGSGKLLAPRPDPTRNPSLDASERAALRRAAPQGADEGWTDSKIDQALEVVAQRLGGRALPRDVLFGIAKDGGRNAVAAARNWELEGLIANARPLTSLRSVTEKTCHRSEHPQPYTSPECPGCASERKAVA